MDIISNHSKGSKVRRQLRYRRLKTLRRLRRFAPRHSWHWVLIFMLLLPVTIMDGCKSKDPKAHTAPKVPVLAMSVVTKDMPVYISALGTVTPISTVTVKTQVEGILQQRYFADGAIVKQGDLIAQVDPRPYQAQLLQYQGQLERDKALLLNARIDLERYKTLFSQDSISQQTLETQIYLTQQYEGDVKNDLGLIAGVKVNLNYCRITAPVAGKLGIFVVDVGNVVQVSDTNGIVIINSMDPIYVDFSIPEDDLPTIAEKLAKQEKLVVYAADRNQNRTLATGFLLTTDNQIDTATGTIKLRSQFVNESQMLFPNQFVNVKLLIDKIKDAIVVPTAAVQYGSNGNYVFVLKDDNTVSLKNVKIAVTVDDETAIIGDIHAGQKVITEGTDKLKDGSTVTILQQNNNIIGQDNNESL